MVNSITEKYITINIKVVNSSTKSNLFLCLLYSLHFPFNNI